MELKLRSGVPQTREARDNAAAILGYLKIEAASTFVRFQGEPAGELTVNENPDTIMGQTLKVSRLLTARLSREGNQHEERPTGPSEKSAARLRSKDDAEQIHDRRRRRAPPFLPLAVPYCLASPVL